MSIPFPKEKKEKKVFRYKAIASGSCAGGTYHGITFIEGEHYYITHYDKKDLVVAGKFNVVKTQTTVDIKPFIPIEVCKKNLVHDPIPEK